MQLSKEQIQQLFSFTEKKYVRYYDLQCELVDHLASRIEEVMSADPKLGFDNALKKVYADFGIFGFSKIVQEKEQQMFKHARSMTRKEFRKLFTWPRLMMTACIGIVIWQLSRLLPVEILLPVLMFVWIASGIFIIRKFNRNKKQTNKNLLLLQYVPDSGLFPVFALEMMIVLHGTNWQPVPFSILVFFIILFKIASFQVHLKLNQTARNLYPDAFVSE